MTLGANQIGAYAADLLDLEDQIEALQTSKRDLYKAIRDEHGKSDANSLKLAVKLSRMDGEKLIEAEAVDTEARRMLAIIEKGRAPRATRAREIIEQFPARETLASTTAADPAGEADDASSADTLQEGSEPIEAHNLDRAGSTPAPATTSTEQPTRPLADEAGQHDGGIDRGSVDTEPGKGALGESPSMASEPATGEASAPASPVVAFAPKPYAGPHDSKGLPRPVGCLNLDRCGSATWRKACHICERAMDVTAGGRAIEHHGAVAS